MFGNSCAVMELWISVNNPEPITLQTRRPVNIIAHETRRTMTTLGLLALALLASHEVRLEWSPTRAVNELSRSCEEPNLTFHI